MDCLFRFSVINTAFSTIAKEVKSKLGNLGGPWFHLLTLWVVFSVARDIWYHRAIEFQMTSFFLATFLMATFYLNLVQMGSPRIRAISKIDHQSTKQFLRTIQHISFVPILWNYIWPPVTGAIDFIHGAYFGQFEGNLFDSARRAFSTLVIIVLIFLVHTGSAPSKTIQKRRASTLPPQRPPSARIRAKTEAMESTKPSIHVTSTPNKKYRSAVAARRKSRN